MLTLACNLTLRTDTFVCLILMHTPYSKTADKMTMNARESNTKSFDTLNSHSLTHKNIVGQ